MSALKKNSPLFALGVKNDFCKRKEERLTENLNNLEYLDMKTSKSTDDSGSFKHPQKIVFCALQKS